MSINSREEANRYYQIINNLVDDYTEKNKIRPSNLKNYLKPGSERFNNFLEKNKLKDIKKADIILKDILEDRESMEKDGVITFESFKIFESDEFKIHSMSQCLYKGIGKATIKYEKLIADHFDTNLGDIDVVDADKHLFKINNWEGEDIEVIIYSEEELGIIRYNIINFIYDELKKKKVKITDSIEIDLNYIINYDSYLTRSRIKFDTDMTIKIITDCLGNNWEFKGEDSKDNDYDYYIWIS